MGFNIVNNFFFSFYFLLILRRSRTPIGRWANRICPHLLNSKVIKRKINIPLSKQKAPASSFQIKEEWWQRSIHFISILIATTFYIATRAKRSWSKRKKIYKKREKEERRNKESQKITLSQGGTSLFPRSFTVWEGGGTLIERFFFSQEPCAPVLAIYPCFCSWFVPGVAERSYFSTRLWAKVILT